MMCSRRAQFEALAATIGCPEWLDDPRLSGPVEWGAHIEDVFRPAVEVWAATRTKLEACQELNGDTFQEPMPLEAPSANRTVGVPAGITTVSRPNALLAAKSTSKRIKRPGVTLSSSATWKPPGSGGTVMSGATDG